MASPAEKAQAPLRIVTAATFLPAFALCIAHGARSGSPVPAVGLVPLAFSSGLSIFQLVRLRRYNKENRKKKQAVVRRPSQELPQEYETAEAAQAAAQEQQLLQGDEERGGEEGDDELMQEPSHPVLTFFADTVLAAAIMVVLVFTWIQKGDSAELAMLAAYATIPLLVNFSIHLYSAVRELSRGLAIPALIQYLAWQVVPGACPDCGRHLRPASTPAMPWFAASNRSTPSSASPLLPASSSPSRGLFGSFKMPPSMKAWKGPRGWKSSDGSGRAAAFLPPWFPGQQRYADLDEDGNYNTAAAGGDETPHPHNGAADVGRGAGADATDEAEGAAAEALVAPYRDDPEAA
ncbi:nucleosomal binding protein, partial [Apiospora sp. TS-2023a]